ncbi:hypothetical protein Droror1_Dr00004786 [Drosera rotundifolia]
MEINEATVPPGFRFHPTEEELVGYYLQRKINSMRIDLDIIVDIDLYKMEPWDIQDRCKLGYDEQREWYFFSHKDKKYPTGTRTNRATAAGFWKATGRDKAVLSKNKMIGMRKTLVFYKGRAPNGRKTDWIIHEYRLQSSEHAPPQEEGWVVCRAFKKPCPSHKQGLQLWNRNFYIHNHDKQSSPSSSVLDLASPMIDCNQGSTSFSQHEFRPFHCDQEFLCSHIHDPTDNHHRHHQLLGLPHLDSPSLSAAMPTKEELDSLNCKQYDDQEGNNWDFVDSLIPSQTPTQHHYDQCNTDNQQGTFLGCFPDL